MRGWGKFSDEEKRLIRQSSAPKLKEYWESRASELSDRKSKLGYYRYQCRFKFGNDPEIIANIKGYELLKKYGMYHKTNNPGGVVRDHRLSCHEGYDLNIDPKIMSHPGNCEFMLHKDNARKTRKSSLTAEKLNEEISKFNAQVPKLVDGHG